MTEPAPAPSIAPADIHNQTLLDNVHPPAWVNPHPAGRYNMVVIGAGTAGLIVAAGAAGLGAKVALIERELMGGDCLNVGCVPSKALLRSARAIADACDAARFGAAVSGAAVRLTGRLPIMAMSPASEPRYTYMTIPGIIPSQVAKK